MYRSFTRLPIMPGTRWAFLLLLFFVACGQEKDEPNCREFTLHDGVGPLVLPYLPALPGSWWAYSDGHTVNTSSTLSLQPIYATYWDIQSGSVHCCYDGAAYMPLYDGVPLYGYTLMQGDPHAGSVCNEQQLAEKRGSKFYWGGSHYGRTCSKTIATDTAITLADGTTYAPCLVMKRAFGIAGPYIDVAQDCTLDYYARGVGLVRHEQYIHHELAVQWDLTAYHIGP
jgi:hypothetical protein